MPTATLMNTEDRERLLGRLDRLRPESKPAWGTLDAARLLCHLGDAMRVALGELAARPTHTWLGRTLGRLVVVHSGLEPPPGKIETAPEMLSTKPTSWEADLAACKELAARVGAGAARAVHPAFGPLTPQEWGKLSWKHIDHHLRQFGV